MISHREQIRKKLLDLGKRKIKEISGQYDLQRHRKLICGRVIYVHKFVPLNTINISIDFINDCLSDLAKGHTLDIITIKRLEIIHDGIK